MGDEAEYLSSHFDGFEGISELFNYGDRVFSHRTGNAKIVGCVEKETLQHYGAGHWLSDYRHPFDPSDFEVPIYIVRYSKGTGRKRGSREKLIHPDELTLISSGKKETSRTNKIKMKDIKCPLCGNEITLKYALNTFFAREHYNDKCYCGCSECEWGVTMAKGTPELAWKDVEKFLAKFPPIMRVHEGDKLHFLDRQLHYQYFATVEKVNLKDMWIKTERGTCRPDDVLKWPWELEQKGGAEQ